MTRVRIALVMNECGQWAAYGDSDQCETMEITMEVFDGLVSSVGGPVVQRWIEADVPSLPVIEGMVA